MNILFLSREYPPLVNGGVGTYVHEMSRLLTKAGHGAFVISESPGMPQRNIEEGVHVWRIKPTRNPWLRLAQPHVPGFIQRLEYSKSASQAMREIMREHRIDLVESCEARAEGFWYYLTHRNPPLVIKLHTPERLVYKLNHDPESLDRRWIECLEEWWIKRAGQLTGLSQAIVQQTRQDYGLDGKQIPVVGNPIDSELFHPGQIKRDAQKTVLYAGRLELRKGVHVLLRAIPLVLAQIPEAKFLFIGADCGMKKLLGQKIDEWGISKSVELIDQVPRKDLVGYYQEAGLCVVPSLWENHPYAVLEAMACGKAVVASAIGGITEIIQDNQNGLLVPAGSHMRLAESIVSLLRDSILCQRIGQNACRHIEEAYAPQRLLNTNLKIYNEAIGRV
ncbi:MAG: glycosyltransferase family 4 protein [Candidatus Omnitrophota bacterium]